MLAVVGRSGSGRSAYLRSLGPVAEGAFGAKARPQDLGGRGREGGATALAEALSAGGLWEVRSRPVLSLREDERAACEVVAGLLGGVPRFDGTFDRMDPWRAGALWAFARGFAPEPGGAAAVTHRLDLPSGEGRIVVLRGGEAVFEGTVAALLARGPASRFEVETGRGGAVAAMVAPLAVDVRISGTTLSFAAREGGEAAVRLLLAGYGDVRSFVVREPTLAEAVGELVGA